jgi:hypothetical protein
MYEHRIFREFAEALKVGRVWKGRAGYRRTVRITKVDGVKITFDMLDSPSPRSQYKHPSTRTIEAAAFVHAYTPMEKQ